MGNCWGKGKREWGAKGGEEVSIQSTWDLSGQESHHDAKEEFQVSKKGVHGRGQGFPSKGLGYVLRYHATLVHIVLIVYMSC
jgi:hypothetical protein